MNEKFLINYLEKYNEITLPNSLDEKHKIRALMNITMPYSLSEEFYKKQDEFLQQEKMAYKNKNTNLIRINKDWAICPEQISKKTILFDEDIKTILTDLAK